MAKQADPKRERLWRDRVRRWDRSGLTVREFCERQGCREISFYFWRRELIRRDNIGRGAMARIVEEPAFVPIRLDEDSKVGELSVPASPTFKSASGEVPGENRENVRGSTELEIACPGGVLVRVAC